MLTRGTLNLIEQGVHYAVTKALDVAVTEALDQRLGPDRRRPVFVNKDPPSNVRDIHKDWRPEEIGFFDPDCEEPGLDVAIHRPFYYRDVYAFVDRLKDVALLRSMEKTQAILPQLLRGRALIWYSTELSVSEKDMLKMFTLDYWYMRLIARFKHSQPTTQRRGTSKQFLEIIRSSAQSQTQSFERQCPKGLPDHITYEQRELQAKNVVYQPTN